jgi:tripeptidyl-peptidase I
VQNDKYLLRYDTDIHRSDVSFTTPTCLRTLYGTIDYTPQVPGNNSIGLNNYLNETNNRNDTYTFLENFRPEAAQAAYEFEIIKIANAQDNQVYTQAVIDADLNVEGNLDAQQILGISWPTPLKSFSTGGSPPFVPDINTPTDTNEPYLTWVNYALAQDDLPQVISSSYGDDEQTVPYSYASRVCSDFAQLGARGISLLVSSGDAGVGSDGTCYSNDNSSTYQFLPAFPAGCPWVTTVGGTANFNPETAVTRFASGGGFSNYFATPDYQSAVVKAYVASLNGTYDGLYSKSGRGYPDVAAQGNHDALVWDGQISTVGGTSASSPTFAAVLTLVNDALIAAGKSPLGFLNPWLYSEGYKALTDITIGSSYGCNTSGFPAQAGWDAVTGFGTPNFGELVKLAC